MGAKVTGEELEVETKPIYRVFGPNGRKLWEGTDDFEAREIRDRYRAEARRIGIDIAEYTVQIRYEVTRLWVGEWEVWTN